MNVKCHICNGEGVIKRITDTAMHSLIKLCFNYPLAYYHKTPRKAWIIETCWKCHGSGFLP